MRDREEAPVGGAAGYAARLFGDLGVYGVEPKLSDAPHPAVDWASSGLMWLTGPERGPVAMAPGGIMTGARGALAALAALAGTATGRLEVLDPGALLGERAARLGWHRRGPVSPGGSCRLLRGSDGWIALNLARPEDLELLPAWLEATLPEEVWSFVTQRVARQPTARWVSRGRLLGLPVSSAGRLTSVPAWLRIEARGQSVQRPSVVRPRVLDLSSLWAGPLCSHLLSLAGGDVVKVECVHRPDGSRLGEPGFYDLLHAGKRSVALDFRSDEGRALLVRLIRSVDIVVESARPRALAQLGIHAHRLVTEIPGLCWVSITGYGRGDPKGNWVGYGDDTAAAAGLADATGAPGQPIFCGDAIADPLTGLHAAVAALASFRSGEARLIDINLRDVTAHVLGSDRGVPACEVRPATTGDDSWVVVVEGGRWPVAAPRARPILERARALGADTEAVLGELKLRC